jgi:radical SAM protein with 4Fe4S-binding SPASM domain
LLSATLAKNVHSDGIVTPCCIDSNRDLIMGNIRKDSIKEIWKNEAYQDIRKKHLDGMIDEVPTCRKCPLAKY